MKNQNYTGFKKKIIGIHTMLKIVRMFSLWRKQWFGEDKFLMFLCVFSHSQCREIMHKNAYLNQSINICCGDLFVANISSWRGDSKEKTWESTDKRIAITVKNFGWMRNLTQEQLFKSTGFQVLDL